MEQTLSWSKPTSFSDVETFGILAGEDNGKNVYVGRAVDRDGNFVPVKILPSLGAAYYAFNGKEEETKDIDFLDNATDFHWVNSKDASADDAALVSGFHIGRAKFNGNVVVGKVDVAKKLLIGSYGGETFELPEYDVLIYKSKGVVYEKIQKASNFPRTVSHQSAHQVSSGSFSFQTITNGLEKAPTDNSHLLSKIRQLELEKLSLVKNQQSHEESIHNQQLRITELSFQLKKLRVENLQLSKNHAHVEERYDTEQRKFSTLEQKLNEAKIENNFLLKRITSLEEATKFESQMVDSYSEKSASSEAYSKTLLTKITNFESTNRTLQNRVFELESEISMTTSNSESLLKRVADYEAVIKNLRLQLETYIKKLELSRNDNDYMVQKLTVLTNSLRTYQSQIECLNNKLQESKTVIASTHSDLARANAQIAKYQAAVSSCYMLNGELMTKVAAMNVSAQNQVGSDCSFNLVNHSSTGFSYGHSFKAIGYGRTASLLEVTGSDLTLQANEGFTPFAPYGATNEKFTPFQPFEEKFTPFAPYATEEPGKVAAAPLNGFSESEPQEFMESM